MRHFPRTGRRATTALLAAALTATLLTAAPAGADDLKDKQKKVEKEIHSAEEDLHSSSNTARKANAALAAAQKKLATAQGVLAAAEDKVASARAEDERMKAELARAEAELDRAEQALVEGERRTAAQQGAVASTIAEYYQQGDPALIAFASLLDARTPADLARQTEMQNVIVDREAQAYQALVAARVLLEVQRKQVQAARDDVELQRKAAAAHLAAMQGLEQQAQAARDDVATLVADSRKKAAAAAAAKAADEAELAKLKREEDRIAAELRKRAAARRAKSAAPAPAASGGLLSPPVNGGRLSSPYGYRKHPIYGYWGMHDGQDWAVGCGTPMYATSSGTVVERYYSSVYGNRLYLDNGLQGGVSVTSVYNHASRYVVGVGAKVKRGQLVGYVGNTGWSTGCHLHFTVLVNGATANPRNWI